MTNDERSPNVQMTKQGSEPARRHSDFAGHAVAGRRRVIPSDLVIRHSSSPSDLIATDTQLAELLEKINAVDRLAVDLYVSTDLRTMTAIWMGLDTVRDARRTERLMLTGDRQLISDMQAWLGLSPFAKQVKVAA